MCRSAATRTRAGKSTPHCGASRPGALAARHLYASGAQRIVVTNRSPEKAEALAESSDWIRTAEALKQLDDAKKQGGMGDDEHVRHKEEIQKLIDAGNEKLAQLLAKKEEEIAQ